MMDKECLTTIPRLPAVALMVTTVVMLVFLSTGGTHRGGTTTNVPDQHGASLKHPTVIKQSQSDDDIPVRYDADHDRESIYRQTGSQNIPTNVTPNHDDEGSRNIPSSHDGEGGWNASSHDDRVGRNISSNHGDDNNSSPKIIVGTINSATMASVEQHTGGSSSSSSHVIIPNVYHYVQFKNGTLPWIMYVSVLSVLRILNPELVYIHTDVALNGPYWERLRGDHRVTRRHLERRRLLNGKKVAHLEHNSDYARFQVIARYGGTYLDNDCLVLAPFHELRRVHRCVVNKSPLDKWVGSQIVMGSRDCEYVQRMLHYYETMYYPQYWYYNAGVVPVNKIMLREPRIAYWYAFGYENAIKDELYGHLWKSVGELVARYPVIHTYFRAKKNDYKDDRDYLRILGTLNTTFGNVARFILYGRESMMLDGSFVGDGEPVFGNGFGPISIT